MAFWMYGLEELRVDLRSFEEAARLAKEGFPFARYVTWAILLDRVLRFPITGSRIRNYDALGGQLLFAYLHQHDMPRLDGRQPADDPLGRTSPREGSTGCARGIARVTSTTGRRTARSSRFWLAGHELVSSPATSTPMSPRNGKRANCAVIKDERDLKRWLALVQEDEFPLGTFHLNLQRRLA